jgi:hypothetical protein
MESSVREPRHQTGESIHWQDDEIPTKPRRELPRPPSFGQWLKQIWLDAVTLLLWGGVGLVVSSARDAVASPC